MMEDLTRGTCFPANDVITGEFHWVSVEYLETHAPIFLCEAEDFDKPIHAEAQDREDFYIVPGYKNPLAMVSVDIYDFEEWQEAEPKTALEAYWALRETKRLPHPNHLAEVWQEISNNCMSEALSQDGELSEEEYEEAYEELQEMVNLLKCHDMYCPRDIAEKCEDWPWYWDDCIEKDSQK
tara:strand:+ start:240 stop:782 length:543 start_codon:yes stop_codon:yes gene_type:complete